MPNRDRPMNSETVTNGSVLILPAYPVAFTLVGLILLLQSPGRTSSSAFDVAKWIMGWTDGPIKTWALIFLLIALVEWISFFLEDRTLFMWTLVVACGITTCWAFMLLASAEQDPFVSFTGGVWVGLGAYAHVASVRSLARDVVFR